MILVKRHHRQPPRTQQLLSNYPSRETQELCQLSTVFRTHVHRIQFLGFSSRDTTANHRGPSSYYPISTAEKPRSYVFKTRVRIEWRNLNVFMYRCLQVYLVPIPCDSKSVWYRCTCNCICISVRLSTCMCICIRICIRYLYLNLYPSTVTLRLLPRHPRALPPP